MLLGNHHLLQHLSQPRLFHDRQRIIPTPPITTTNHIGLRRTPASVAKYQREKFFLIGLSAFVELSRKATLDSAFSTKLIVIRASASEPSVCLEVHLYV